MDIDEVKSFISEFWGIGEFDKDIKFSSRALEGYSSIRFYQFIAAFEANFDTRIKDITRISKLGDLIDEIGH